MPVERTSELSIQGWCGGRNIIVFWRTVTLECGANGFEMGNRLDYDADEVNQIILMSLRKEKLEHDHTAAAIAERISTVRHNYVRDWIYGGVDGAVTTFASIRRRGRGTFRKYRADTRLCQSRGGRLFDGGEQLFRDACRDRRL